jgi:hypothetical protein
MDRFNWKSTAHNEPWPPCVGRDNGAARPEAGGTFT